MPNLDVSADYLIMDWLQELTYYSRISETVYSVGMPVRGLKREDHKYYSMEGESVETAMHGVIWSIWTDTMETAFIPKRGDKFTATGISGEQVWIVIDVDYSDRTTRYRLRTIQEGMGS